MQTLSTSTRPWAARVRPAAARRALTVASPRDRDVSMRFSHRAEQLTDLAKEVGCAWAKALTARPGEIDGAVDALESLCAPGAVIRSTHPLGCAKFSGLDLLRQRLRSMHEHGHAPAPSQHAQVLLAAADEQSDTAFCLVQLPGATPTDPRPAYVLLKMDVTLDDVSRCVTSLVERAQLPASLAAAPDDALAAQHLAAQQQRAAPFPTHQVAQWRAVKQAGAAADHSWRRIHSHGDKRVGPGSQVYDEVQRALAAWVRARNSDADTAKELHDAGATGPTFELLDAFGMVPLMCQPPPETAARAGKAALSEPEGPLAARAEDGGMGGVGVGGEGAPCKVSGAQVGDLFTAMKAVYDIKTQVVDVAVCMDEAAAFVHWRSSQRNRVTGMEFDIEGLEVDLLDAGTGQLKSAFLFRDLMDFEQALLDA